MKRFLAWALAALAAAALPARAANYTDHWWNKDESGWGLTLTHHNDKLFGVWYVYDTDGRPLWVVMPDGAFTADGKSYSGALYRTTGPAYRDATFNASRVTTTAIGTARLDFGADESSATVTYTIAGTTSTKAVTRQPFGAAPANPPDDLTDLWWNPDESGWGLAVTHHGDNIFAVWYTYAEDGRPLWVVLPGGTFTAARAFTGKLYTTTGSPYTAHFSAPGTRVEEVGSATLEFTGSEGRFTSTVRGFTQSKRIVRQPFGGAAGTNKRPTVQLSLSGASNAVAPASITLKANAADSDGRIAKVVFYEGCERIGEATTSPFQLAVPGLGAGRYTFSARAVDDKGATALATSSPVDVRAVVNKLPQVALASPADNAYFGPDAAVELTATARDPDGTVAKVEYFDGSMKVGESAQSPWRVTWTTTSGDHTFIAVATDDKGASATSASIAVKVAGPAVVFDAPLRDAARFLTQATFGPRGVAEIQALRARGYDSWLAEQFGATAASHLQFVNDRKAAGEKAAEERAYEAIWQQWLWEPGQLRARTAFALSEIFVISNVAPDLDTYAMASYMDLLNRNAFGNFRQLLEDVTLHPAMGYYLNMIGSKKADPAKGTHPNENYAREVMQLFTIGLYKLNPDGTRQVDAQGKPIPTYGEAAIAGMAAALTGWSFAGNDTSRPGVFDPARENWLEPMIPWEMWHDTGAKTLFDGITLPAAQGARKDLKDALDALFNHPNVGPFIARRLIQRFVTSNPGPAYIARVTAAFNDNGQGVRGDLRAVVRAVLMDPDARDLARAATETFGKQREPVIRFANILRAFNAASPTGRNRIWYLDSADEGLNQSPLLSPSVFNFFSPDYRPAGGTFTFLGMVAPEFQITTETSMVGTLNFFGRLARNGSYGSGDTKLTLDLAELTALANDPAALADRLNILLMAGGMSPALRSNLITALAALPKTSSSGAVNDRVKAALILVAFAPDFAIQR